MLLLYEQFFFAMALVISIKSAHFNNFLRSTCATRLFPHFSLFEIPISLYVVFIFHVTRNEVLSPLGKCFQIVFHSAKSINNSNCALMMIKKSLLNGKLFFFLLSNYLYDIKKPQISTATTT
jgi:hypothetical protein